MYLIKTLLSRKTICLGGIFIFVIASYANRLEYFKKAFLVISR